MVRNLTDVRIIFLTMHILLCLLLLLKLSEQVYDQLDLNSLNVEDVVWNGRPEDGSGISWDSNWVKVRVDW